MDLHKIAQLAIEFSKNCIALAEENEAILIEHKKKQENKMGKEWKELGIDDLPADYLTGDYEFEIEQGYGFESAHATDSTVYRVRALFDIATEKTFKVSGDEDVLLPVKYRYRKRAPKAPTHEEIMTKWWFLDSGEWARVGTYRPHYDGHTEGDELKYYLGGYRCKEWFTGRESADIPPEANNE